MHIVKKMESFLEKGVRPKGQGKRSDIDAATDILSNGGSMQEVAVTLPSVFVKSTGV